VTTYRAWAVRHRLMCALLAALAVVLCSLPASVLAISLPRDNFPGWTSPIFVVPVVMLGLFGAGAVFCTVSFILGLRWSVRRDPSRGDEPED